MAQRSISRIRDCIRSLNYVVSLHAAEALEDDKLTILDLENIVLTGEIAERQRDRQTREVKFIIRGRTIAGQKAEVVAKFGQIGALFIITIYCV